MRHLVELELERQADVAVARLDGEVDISNAKEVEAEIAAAVSNDAWALVVDLSRVVYLDSAGIRLLVGLARRLRTRGQELRIAIPEGAPIKEVLVLSNLEEVAPLHATVEEAVTEIGREVNDHGG
jgi:anti-sigma B factor antagonist